MPQVLQAVCGMLIPTDETKNFHMIFHILVHVNRRGHKFFWLC